MPRTTPTAGLPLLHIEIPVRVRSEANLREHWAQRARRAKHQRDIAATVVWAECALQTGLGLRQQLPLTITLTRLGGKRLDDDNLARGCKACRDGIADALKIDDGDPRLTWRYEQQSDNGKVYSVRVRIERTLTVPTGT